MKTKVCTKCKVEKEINLFNKDKSKKDGCDSHCKNCKVEYRKKNGINNYINNLENLLKYKKTYRENNKEHIREYRKLWKAKTKENNPLYNFIHKIRNNIHKFIITKNSNRTNSKTYQILGCTPNEFKLHLESQFEPWMNWDNRGLYNGQLNHGWDVDHIISMASAKTEEDVIKLNHYTNLRPRCSYLNRVIDNIKYKIEK
jgi:hypothetical protein